MALAMRDWLGLLGVGFLIVLYSVDPWIMQRHFLGANLTDEVAETKTSDKQTVGKEKKTKNMEERKNEVEDMDLLQMVWKEEKEMKNIEEQKNEVEEMEDMY